MNVTTGRRQARNGQTYLLVVMVVSVAAVFSLMSHGFSKTLAPPVEEYTEVVVLEGDTLWQIARRHGGPDVDTRRMVDRIREANDLAGVGLRPGQVLKVPAP